MMKLTRFKLALLLYVAFDFLIGGHCGGLLPLGTLAAAQSGPPAIGNITSAGSTCSTTSTPTNCVILQLDAATSAATIQVIGTYSATNQFEVSSDNQTTWSNVSCTPPNSATAVSSTTSTGLWQCNVAGYTHIRARASAYTSGTAAITINSGHSVPSIVTGVSTASVGTNGGTAPTSSSQGGCEFETTPTTVSTGQMNAVHCDSSGRQIVTGAFASGQASAVSLPGMPMLCDSATSGTVTAAQAQMVKCDTGGILKLGLNAGNGDTVSASETAIMTINAGANPLQVAPKLFNGSTTSRPYAASLANLATAQTLTARNSAGVQLTEKGSRWMVISNPAANAQATASIASEASVRHVVDCVSFSAGATTAPALTALTINVRDGASGAGTIIWTYEVIIPAATGQSVAPHSICGLNLVGTTATAMTAEFSAGLTSLVESVSISGYNVN